MSVSTIGVVTATSNLTSLTNSGSANTQGPWVEISSSTPEPCQSIIVVIRGGGLTADALFDIALGGSGSEVILISNVLVRIKNSTINNEYVFYFPVAIPSGSRVSMRFQATSSSASLAAAIYLCNNSNSIIIGSCTPTTYGAVTADSGGTQVDPGATINTKGSYSELIASTTDDIDFMVVQFNLSNDNDAAISAGWLVDIATGGAGSETVQIANISTFVHSGTDVTQVYSIGPFPVTIPAGSRLAARAQCTTNDATDRLIDITVLGLNGSGGGGGGGGAEFSAAFYG